MRTDNQLPLLEVRGLSVGYPTPSGLFRRPRTVVAVDGIDFDIRTGETLAFVGESGSGKSTTGKAILRMADVLAGTIRFDGQDITEWGATTPLSYRQNVQAVFQDPSASLNPRKLVSQTLEASLQRHGVRDRREQRTRMAETIEMVGLSSAHLGRFPSELSGGQQQRVAIARALILHPRLVVCDEAVSALDMSTQGQIINLLEDLQQRTGVSYLFIAHDLGLVRHIAHRVGVMDRGRLVELADTEQLFHEPRDEYTKRLLAATPASRPEGRDERRAQRLAERDAA